MWLLWRVLHVLADKPCVATVACCACRVWLQRIQVLYEFVAAGVSVVMSDLDAIWVRDAVADLLHKADGQERGFDLMMSPGYFPFDVHKQMGVVGKWTNTSGKGVLCQGCVAASRLYLSASSGVVSSLCVCGRCLAGCMGFLFANATSAAQSLLATMLREKLHQLQLREVKFYNDQRILNEQLLRVRAGWGSMSPHCAPFLACLLLIGRDCADMCKC